MEKSSGSPRERRVRRRFPLWQAAFLLAALFGVGKYFGEPGLHNEAHHALRAAHSYASQAFDQRQPPPPRNERTRHGSFSGTVTRIIDGDTFMASFSDRPVRIWGKIIS